jgi:putative ABC transport system permease protein
VMRALDRKLLRDLWRLRGQVVAVAMVIASGVAVLVMSLSTLEALEETAEAYYDRYRFASVFANLKRAPERLAERVADLPGVQAVETRITRFAIADIEGFAEPVIVRLISVPERGEPLLNRLALRAGRSVAPGRPDEVVLSEPFAEAHHLRPGDRIRVLMNGKKRRLDVVGIALSPEFVYALPPGGLMPDDKRFGVLWMGREALAAAYDFKGAFNDVTLSLQRGVEPRAVIDRLDHLLERFGGIGAIARADQLSNWFLMNEIEQLGIMSRILPAIFLAVAAFLTQMVLGRLIAIERGEIGLMKAFGYRNAEVGWHYAKMVICMALIGIGLGAFLGAWLGRFNTELYAEFYRFPLLVYRPGPTAFAIGAVVSLASALGGSIRAVRRAAALPPAEAMQPPAPEVYRHAGIGTGMSAWLDQPTRIILRQIGRSPLRSALTSTAVALSVGLVIMALQWVDSIEHLIDVFFYQSQHQNVMVGLVETQSSVAMYEFGRMPGVLGAEPMRIVSANLRSGARAHRGSITGLPSDPWLQTIYDSSGRTIAVPEDGLVLGTVLAKKLGVGVGDEVWIEVLEGRRPTLRLPVVDLVETYIGLPAYLHIAALDRMMRERPSVEYANLLVDESRKTDLFAKLKEMPKVSAVSLRDAAVQAFHETMGETLMIFVGFFVAFACTLGFGVVYNSARIALSERGRELATLRVLGFTRLEISYILLGEVSFLIVAALPLGCLIGRGLAAIMTSAFETELYRVPLVIHASTYGSAVLIALAATAVSGALVRRRVDHLDLIEVLKTRE